MQHFILAFRVLALPLDSTHSTFMATPIPGLACLPWAFQCNRVSVYHPFNNQNSAREWETWSHSPFAKDLYLQLYSNSSNSSNNGRSHGVVVLHPLNISSCFHRSHIFSFPFITKTSFIHMHRSHHRCTRVSRGITHHRPLNKSRNTRLLRRLGS